MRRRRVHALACLRPRPATLLLFVGTFVTGLALLLSLGANQAGRPGDKRPVTVAEPVAGPVRIDQLSRQPVRIDEPSRQPGAAAARSRSAERAASGLSVASGQLLGAAPPAKRPIDSHPSDGNPSSGWTVASRTTAAHTVAPRTQPAPTSTGTPPTPTPTPTPTSIVDPHPETLPTHPHQSSQPSSSSDIGKPFGSPRPITPIPSNSSAAEQPFFCFIAHAAPATSCPGPAANVGLKLSPTVITASTSSTSVATATVTDSSGDNVIGDTVSFSASPAADVTFASGSTCTTGNNGQCSVTITGTTTAGPVTITATDTSATPGVGSSPQTLTLTSATVGPAANVSVTLNPNSIAANGTSTTTATATVTDANGLDVIGDNVSFSANPASGVTIGQITNNHDGTYTATITSGTLAQPVAITATDTSPGALPTATGTATLTLTTAAGPAANVSLSLNPTSIAANGTATTTATATVSDANHLPVTGDNISFSATPAAGVTIGQVTNNHDGTYTATISGTKPGSVAITATDSSARPSISSSPATLTLTSTIGPAAKVTVQLNPGTIVADGVSTTTATATVTDAAGHPVTNDAIKFSASPAGVVIGATSNNGDGTYSSNITSSTTAGPVTITATDTSSSALPTALGTTTLNLTSQAAAQSITVAVSPVAIYADGTSHAFATATITSNFGTGVSGDAVQFYVDGSPVGGVCTTDSNGQCHITLTASTTVGIETVTATDIGANISTQQPAQLTLLTPLPPPPPPPPPPTTTTTTPSSSTHLPSPGPTTRQIASSLASVLAPTRSGASIKQILKTGVYTFVYRAPGAGRLTIDWYDDPGKRQELIGGVTVTVGKAGKAPAKVRLTNAGRTTLKAKLKLTNAGRSKLKASKTPLKVTSKVTFKAPSEPAVSRSATFMLH